MIHVAPSSQRTISPLGALWRALLVGVAYLVALTLGGLVTSVLGLANPLIAESMNPTQALISSFAAGALIALALGPLAIRLNVPLWNRILVLASVTFVVGSLINLIEALYFTTMFETGIASALIGAAIGYLGLAAALAYLFPPELPIRRMRDATREIWQQRTALNWLGRIVLAALAYVPIYLGIGMLIAPIVTPYYTNPALGLGLRIPGFDVILPLEVVRSLLMVLALFPIVCLWRESRLGLALMLGWTVAILGGIVPMLSTSFFPPILRITHGIEITVDSFLLGFMLAWLLGSGPWRMRRG